MAEKIIFYIILVQNIACLIQQHKMSVSLSSMDIVNHAQGESREVETHRKQGQNKGKHMTARKLSQIINFIYI